MNNLLSHCTKFIICLRIDQSTTNIPANFHNVAITNAMCETITVTLLIKKHTRNCQVNILKTTPLLTQFCLNLNLQIIINFLNYSIATTVNNIHASRTEFFCVKNISLYILKHIKNLDRNSLFNPLHYTSGLRPSKAQAFICVFANKFPIKVLRIDHE